MMRAEELRKKNQRKNSPDINSFLGSIKGQPLANEKLIYSNGINGAFQRKLKK
jgi:hypothetical protein